MGLADSKSSVCCRLDEFWLTDWCVQGRVCRLEGGRRGAVLSLWYVLPTPPPFSARKTDGCVRVVDTKVGYGDGQKRFGWNVIGWSGSWPVV